VMGWERVKRSSVRRCFYSNHILIKNGQKAAGMVGGHGAVLCIISSGCCLTACSSSVVVGELYLGLIHISCVTSHLSSSQRVQLLIGINGSTVLVLYTGLEEL